MDAIRNRIHRALRWSEQFLKTDMIYAASGGFWMILGQAILAITSLVLAVLFARLVPKDAYGTYKYIIAVMTILGAFTLSGLETSMFRSVAQGFEQIVRKAFWTKVRWSLGASAGAALFGIYYLWKGNETLGIGLLACAVFLPFFYFGSTTSAFLRGRRNFRAASMYSIAQSFLYTALMIVAVIFIRDALGLTVAYLFITASVAVGLYLLALHRYKPNDAELPDAHRLSKHLSFLNILGTAANQGDDIILFHYLGPVSVSVYSFAGAIPQQFTGLISIAYALALPKFATMSKAEGKKIVLQRTWYFIATAAAISLLYILAAPYIFRIFFPTYLASVPYSQVIILDFFIPSIATLLGGYIDAHSLIREKYIIGIISNVSRVILMIIGGALWGIWGVIAGTVIALVISCITNFTVIFFFT